MSNEMFARREGMPQKAVDSRMARAGRLPISREGIVSKRRDSRQWSRWSKIVLEAKRVEERPSFTARSNSRSCECCLARQNFRSASSLSADGDVTSVSWTRRDESGGCQRHRRGSCSRTAPCAAGRSRLPVCRDRLAEDRPKCRRLRVSGSGHTGRTRICFFLPSDSFSTPSAVRSADVTMRRSSETGWSLSRTPPPWT